MLKKFLIKDKKELPFIKINDSNSNSCKYIKDLLNQANNVVGKPIFQYKTIKEFKNEKKTI